MKVLLDENLDHRLRKLLGSHDVYTVDFMDWAGLRNGELLSVAEAKGFEVFLTGDKNLAYQQNLAGRRMAIVTLSAIDLDILRPNLSLVVAAIESVSQARFSRSSAARSNGKTLDAFPQRVRFGNVCGSDHL